MIGSIWLSPKGETFEVIDSLNTCVDVKDTAGVCWRIPKRHFQGSWREGSYTCVEFEAGSTWKHKKKGTLYEIVLVANRYSGRSDFGLTIVYKSDELKLHACSAASFYQRMQHD